MTPINQVITWLSGEDPAQVDDGTLLFLSALIHLEAEAILDMKTKGQRRAALSALPDQVRETVEREIMSIWNKAKAGKN